MWIVIDIPGFDPDNAIIATDEDGLNLSFDTPEVAQTWAEENCVWGYKVVEI